MMEVLVILVASFIIVTSVFGVLAVLADSVVEYRHYQRIRPGATLTDWIMSWRKK